MGQSESINTNSHRNHSNQMKNPARPSNRNKYASYPSKKKSISSSQ